MSLPPERENFRSYPQKDQAIKLAQYLDCKPEELFPEWLKMFKPKRTSVVTEHLITEPLIEDKMENLLIEDGMDEFTDKYDKELLHGELEKQLDTLSFRERAVLEFRFGLGQREKDGEDTGSVGGISTARTLEETARKFAVTRERIRQIEAKALRKLRHPARSGKLKAFLT